MPQLIRAKDGHSQKPSKIEWRTPGEPSSMSAIKVVARVLTRDNTLLSRPTIEPSAIRQTMVESPRAPPLADPFCASICTNHPAGTVTAYVEAGTTPATRRAYRTDLDHFKAWGGTLPAANAQVVNTLPTTLPC